MNITKTLAICLAAALTAALTACGPARPAATPESDAEASAKTGASAESAAPEPDAYAEAGTETERGFVLDNVLHSSEGDIHYNLYTPESYDGSEPRALFVTLAGYEGLYFQGVGANLAEDFGFEAQDYDPDMLVLAPQLNDWGETSARQTIALVEYFLAEYSIDPARVYLHGMSGGGETASLVMGMRPELFAACLVTSTRWDGDLDVLAASRTPVYMAIGDRDSYYGAQPLTDAYNELHAIYASQGLSDAEIDGLLVLDVRSQDFFDAPRLQRPACRRPGLCPRQYGHGLAVFAHEGGEHTHGIHGETSRLERDHGGRARRLAGGVRLRRRVGAEPDGRDEQPAPAGA